MAAPDLRNPSELSETHARKLKDAGFKLTASINKGVIQQYNYESGSLNFALACDRGYYECSVYSGKSKKHTYPLIALIRFLRNDKNYYVNELKMADLKNTLEVDQYVELFCKNLEAIKTFFARPDNETREVFDAFGLEG